MKRIIIFLILFPSSLCGQNIAIYNPLIIGIDNRLKIEGFEKNDSLSIEAPFNITSERVGQEDYILKVSITSGFVQMVLKNRNIVIDTIAISVVRTTLKQHLTTNGYGLITSGDYPLEVVKSIKSIELRTNIPDKEIIRVLGYTIEIIDEREIILQAHIDGGSFNHPEIMRALKRLKRNGLVSIKKIHASTPWSDGNQPQDVYLKVK